MSQEETKIADTKGRFVQVERDGRPLDDASWTNGRILLSNKRLILAGGDQKETIPLGNVTEMGGRYDVNQDIAQVSEYLSFRIGEDDVFLVAAAEAESFETGVFKAYLDQRVVLAKHPAVEGGVVQDTQWQKARLKISQGELGVALAGGTFVLIELDDIGKMESSRRTVKGKERGVLEVEHSEEGTSVETHFSANNRICSVLETLVQKGEEQTETSIDLSETEKEVLMALYSGVSPFDIPDFIGLEVDRVEEIFERLVELEVVEEVRKRHEVALNARGRNIASDTISDS